MKKNVVKNICIPAVIAALYTVCTVLVPAISYGPLQFRLGEALTVLPVFTPLAIPGLVLGCFLSNLFGITTGANVAGAWDLLFGTAATLFAALCTYALRNIKWFRLPLFSLLPPVLFNAVIIGAELAIALFDSQFSMFIACAAEVGASEILSAVVGGSLLYLALNRPGIRSALFQNS
ncbi:MAG: QueT transporter family protein [Clostridia bacterium]|nr:QueT transporter family protein [Clostridia bacterium]